MADIDELRIEVNANAKNASAGLDKLCDSLNRIKKGLNGGQIKGLQGMSNGIKEFSKSLSGFNSVPYDNIAKFSRSINSLTKGTSQANISSKADEIRKLADAMKGFNALGDFGSKSKDMASFFRSLSRLDAAKLKEVFTVMPKASSAIKSMMNEMSKTKAVDKGITSLISAIGRLSGEKMKSARVELPQLTSALKRLFDTLKQMPKISDNTAKVVDAISRLSGRSGSVRSVASSFNALQSSGNRVSSMVHSLTSKLRSLTNGFRSVNVSAKSMVKGFLASYASLWGIKSAISGIKDAVISATDYIEQYNFYNVALGKIASEWKDDYAKYGYENADAYGKSFSNRLKEMMSKMTGFRMNDDGTLTDLGLKNLGIDATEITKFSANIAQLTNSLGMCGEASTITSKALSMVAVDQASYMNVTNEEAMQNFSSGIIGQSRALYKYGIDITNTTLQQYAYANGVRKSVSEMTQAEKMQLRLLAILDQSKVAYGDLAHTINSPSNQIKLLKNNFAALSRTIGNMFLPVVAKVLPYVNGLVIAIRRLFEWTASMLGLDLKDIIGNSGTGYDDTFADVADDADDASNAIGGVADATDKATEAQKKLNKQLQGFDKLNNMSTTTTSGSNGSDGSSGSGSGSGGGAPIDLTSQLSDALKDYENVWNKAYKDMTSDADNFANKLTKLFKDAWQSGDGSDIGSAIASWLNSGLKWVNDNWKVVDNQVQKIADILSSAVNGFTYKFDWSGLGTALSNTLQTWLDGETTFFDKTDWGALGNGVAKSLNAFIGDGEKGPIQSYLKNVASKLRAAIEFAFGLITTFDFKNLGTSIGNGINDFFDKMGKKNPKTKLNGWEELGKSISDGILGITDTLNTALKKVHWEDVGQAIADFIGQIKWGKIVWNLAKCAKSLGKGIIKALATLTAKNPLAGAVVTLGVIKPLFSKGWNKLLSSKIGSKVAKSKIGASIGKVLARVKDWGALKKDMALSKLKSKIGNLVKGVTTNVKNVAIKLKDWTVKGISKTSLGQKIAEKVGPEVSVPPIVLTFGKGVGIVGLLTAVTVEAEKYNKDFESEGEGIGTQIKNGVVAALKFISLYDLVASINDAIYGKGSTEKNFKDDAKNLTDSSKWKDAFEPIIDGIDHLQKQLEIVQDAVNNKVMNPNWWKGKWSKLKNWFDKNIHFPKIKVNIGTPKDWEKNISAWWENIKGWWNKHVHFPKISIPMAKPSDWMKSIKGWWSGVTSWWKKKVKLPKIDFPTMDDVTGQVEEKWNSLKNWWDKNAKLFIDIPSIGDFADTVKDGWRKIHDWWGKDRKLHGVKIDVTSIYDNVKNTYTNARNWIKARTKSPMANVSITVSKIHSIIKARFSDAKSWLKGKTIKIKVGFEFLKNALTSMLNSVISSINNHIIGPLNKIRITIPKWVPEIGGKSYGFNVSKLSTFANGGFPEMGQVFVANEAGPELVGNIGHKNAVMNNNQIVQSVSDGVFNALAPVLTQMCNSINSLNSKIGGMNGGMQVEKYTEGDLLKVVRKENTRYKNIHGKSALT